MRASLRNINIDRTTFCLSLPSRCILNTRPIPNDHLVEMELEGNKVEEVVEVKGNLHCCSSWTTSWWSAGLIILELTVKIFLAWIDFCDSSSLQSRICITWSLDASGGSLPAIPGFLIRSNQVSWHFSMHLMQYAMQYFNLLFSKHLPYLQCLNLQYSRALRIYQRGNQ